GGRGDRQAAGEVVRELADGAERLLRHCTAGRRVYASCFQVVPPWQNHRRWAESTNRSPALPLVGCVVSGEGCRRTWGTEPLKNFPPGPDTMLHCTPGPSFKFLLSTLARLSVALRTVHSATH